MGGTHRRSKSRWKTTGAGMGRLGVTTRMGHSAQIIRHSQVIRIVREGKILVRRSKINTPFQLFL